MRPPRFGSIKTRLAVAYIVAFFLMGSGLIVVRVLVAETGSVEVSLDTARQLAVHLVDDIGTPPDPRVLAELEHRGIVVRVGSSNQNPLGLPLVTVDREGYRFAFQSLGHRPPPLWVLAFVVLVVILVSLTTSYLITRRMLLPLEAMSRVALELGVKDWKARVNPEGNDELATTGRALDQMAERIEHHVTSMDEFLATVSHELRSPLARLRMLQLKVADPAVGESILEEIRILDTLTSQLLEHRRLTSQPESLSRSAHDLLEWSQRALAPYASVGAPVVLEAPGSGHEGWFDEGRLDQALRNLVDNALRYAGPVTVGVQPREGRGFVVWVEDHGPGMPTSLLGRIGEPFLNEGTRTGSRTQGGFGLGLSIVKAVAEAHGGEMRATNRESGGFLVTLDFPPGPAGYIS